jgi:hypothetical protein
VTARIIPLVGTLIGREYDGEGYEDEEIKNEEGDGSDAPEPQEDESQELYVEAEVASEIYRCNNCRKIFIPEETLKFLKFELEKEIQEFQDDKMMQAIEHKPDPESDFAWILSMNE